MIKSIVKFSQVEARLDAEFYHPAKLRALRFLISDKKINDYFYSYRNIANPQGSEFVNLVDLENVANFSINNVKRVRKSEIGSTKKHFKLGDVLISRLRSYLKQILIIDEKQFIEESKNFCSTEFIVLRRKNKKISPEILYSYLQSSQIQTVLAWSQEGTNHPRFSENYLLDIPFPGQLLKKSKKIKLFVDKARKKRQQAKQKYQKAQELLNEYLDIKKEKFKFPKTFSIPFSKLKDRFDGEYYQTKSLDYINLLKKSGNKIIKLEDIAEEVKYGTSDKVIYQKNGVPFLRVTDINKFNTIEPRGGKFISENEAQKLKSYQTNRGDLLISRTGTLGSVVYVSNDLDGSVFGSYFIKVSPKKEKNILPLYVSVFLNSKTGKLQTDKIGSGGIQTNLTIDMIENLIFPVLDIKKQKKICNLYTKSLLLQKVSKELLEKAKDKIENIIKKGK